jgi:hypothetical protein
MTVHRGKSSHRRIFRYVTSHAAGAETTYRGSYAKSMHLPANEKGPHRSGKDSNYQVDIGMIVSSTCVNY